MARISKKDWIRRGLEVLSEEGYHAIRIDWLCDRFKITKGSFYHHFDSLEDYERHLLKYWEKETLSGLAKVLEGVESPEGRINRMIQWVFGLSATLELSLRAWALHNEEVKKLLTNMEVKRIGLLVGMYIKIGVPKKEAREMAELGHATWIGIQACHLEGVVNKEKSIRLIDTLMRMMVKKIIASPAKKKS